MNLNFERMRVALIMSNILRCTRKCDKNWDEENIISVKNLIFTSYLFAVNINLDYFIGGIFKYSLV